MPSHRLEKRLVVGSSLVAVRGLNAPLRVVDLDLTGDLLGLPLPALHGDRLGLVRAHGFAGTFFRHVPGAVCPVRPNVELRSARFPSGALLRLAGRLPSGTLSGRFCCRGLARGPSCRSLSDRLSGCSLLGRLAARNLASRLAHRPLFSRSFLSHLLTSEPRESFGRRVAQTTWLPDDSKRDGFVRTDRSVPRTVLGTRGGSSSC